MRRQKTIENIVTTSGVGLHKGKQINLRLEPLPVDSGIVFFRSDKDVLIEVRPENIVNTQMATVLGSGDVTISTIEHLLSAIYAYGIDNLKICVDDNEIPVMDGSSSAFCILLDEAGITEQEKSKKQMIIKKSIKVQDGDKFVEIIPQKSPEFEFSIKFEHPAIAEQNFEFDFNKKNYIKEISRARTFGFLKDIEKLQSMGLALGGNLNNAVVLDDQRILNVEGLRYPNEFVRHKILDAIGDMAIVGYEIIGKYNSHAGSHHLNHLLTKKVLQDSSNYELVSEQVAQDYELAAQKV
ncbi:MAG: UDP-3-O-[3-hydroxymyristoyl] N-acetylglucosamine deacetylase (EC [uncultured Campylobacterales bacterium]|uniref:UDP-3-O-acyl-N-acetylglucosamine deacetylase n=1 Tax=uncultured Campylobacterales bacterium TaxID=352960 RepID=A0A6S6SQQ0_9BACT|nr:MAG: UDP-3-O-[3-hydroxymyristoyl] N-acetylglucosamine deacetylase (EC [uncultured Campylobacterales bacterium]